MWRLMLGGALCSVLSTTTVAAAETIKYAYDAQGRLIRVARTGSVNNNASSDYEHDRADNRKRVKAAGSANPVQP